jgi:hypothetical protein
MRRTSNVRVTQARSGAATGLAAAISLVLTACGSTTGPITPIAGHSFAVATIGGRAMPTTLGVPGKSGTCDQLPVTSVNLVFGTDGTFREVFSAAYAGNHFVEERTGTLVIINDVDTASIAQGTMRVVLNSINCAHEELIARAIP